MAVQEREADHEHAGIDDIEAVTNCTLTGLGVSANDVSANDRNARKKMLIVITDVS